MGRRKRSARGRSDVLKVSSPDVRMLGEAVETRFLELCKAYLRTNGFELVPPKALDRDILRWRQMRVRHRSGDPRHTESEELSTRAVAQWTVDVNCELRNQEPVKIQWGD